MTKEQLVVGKTPFLGELVKVVVVFPSSLLCLFHERCQLTSRFLTFAASTCSLFLFGCSATNQLPPDFTTTPTVFDCGSAFAVVREKTNSSITMSLVGSSVKVDKTKIGASLTAVASADSQEDESTLQDMVTAYDEEDGHPPPTPPGAMESLFLSGLPTQNISASALAEQIHIRHRPLSLAGTSIATDDFVSATDILPPYSPFSMLENDSNDHIDDQTFGNDALIHSRQALFSEELGTMAATTTATTTSPEPKPLENLDPAEKIYDTAKGVWGWGKGIIIFSPFMGIAEGIAGKIVETAGSNLAE
jgi:hypothetical protein